MSGRTPEYNVCFAKKYTSKGQDKQRWVQVGAAFRTAKGIHLRLDAMPIGFSGELMLFENVYSKPAGAPSYETPAMGSPQGGDTDFDDEIPF